MDTFKIAERINLLSKQNGTTINKVLAECSLNKSIVDNLKKGSMPTADKLYAISIYFNVSTDYLLTGKTHIEGMQCLPEDKKRLLKYYSLLTDLEKGELLGDLKNKTVNRDIASEKVDA